MVKLKTLMTLYLNVLQKYQSTDTEDGHHDYVYFLVDFLTSKPLPILYIKKIIESIKDEEDRDQVILQIMTRDDGLSEQTITQLLSTDLFPTLKDKLQILRTILTERKDIFMNVVGGLLQMNQNYQTRKGLLFELLQIKPDTSIRQLRHVMDSIESIPVKKTLLIEIMKKKVQ